MGEKEKKEGGEGRKMFIPWVIPYSESTSCFLRMESECQGQACFREWKEVDKGICNG